MGVLQITFVSILLLLKEHEAAPREDQGLVCYDWKGQPIMEGFKYIPKKEDPCMACRCEDGFPIMCTAVLCSPPECHMWEQVDGECCRFNCIEPDHPNTRNRTDLVPRNTKTNGDVDKANLGLRLIASTVTSFLILALLIFMVHRLRQRRMLIMMRRMHGDRRDEEAVAYMSNFDQVDMGIEFPPYEEPPPPYTPPKPPDIPQGEAPPPYTLNPSGENSNQRETNNNNTAESNQSWRGGRPLQGTGNNNTDNVNNAVAALATATLSLRANGNCINTTSTLDPTTSTTSPADQHLHHHHNHHQDDTSTSLSISRSNREIMAHTEALTPPGGNHRGIQLSPIEPEYENLRSATSTSLHQGRQCSADFSSAAETESVVSSPDFSPDGFYTGSPHIATAVAAGTAAVAPAVMSNSYTNRASPSSQVMVRMHNDSPQSHLIRTTNTGTTTTGTTSDVMTTSAPPCLGLGLGEEDSSRVHPAAAMNHSLSYMEDNKRPFLPSYRTQFLKRSDSVEIKLGSNSPRNSFYHDDPLDGHCSRNQDFENAAFGSPHSGGYNMERSSLSCSPESDQSSRSLGGATGGRSKSKRHQVPNVTWNKSCRPFRIRLANEDSSLDFDQETESKERYEEGVPQKAAYRHSSYIGTCAGSPSPPSSISHRNSLPPMELDLPDPVDAILGASGTKYHKTTNPGGGGGCSTGGSSDPSPCEGRLEVGVSPTGSGKVSTTGSSDISPMYIHGAASAINGSAPHLSPNTVSPPSPSEPSMVRSGSITSQVSQFSVCSETGEKKRPKPTMTFPRSLRNDSRYPLSPFSSNYAAPMSSVPPMTRSSRGQAKRSGLAGGARNNGSRSITSPCESSCGVEQMDQSPTEGTDLLTTSTTNTNNSLGTATNTSTTTTATKPSNLNEDPRPRPIISYVDVSPERELSDGNTASSSSTDSSSAYPKHPTSPMTNDSTMSSLSPLSPDGDMYNQNLLPSATHVQQQQHKDQQGSPVEAGEAGCWPDSERQTMRKLKKQNQKKRNSRGGGGANVQDGGAVVNGFSQGAPDPVSQSPERHRRVSRTIDASTTFKQYGFIDDPDVLNNARDHTGNVTVQSNSLPRNYDLRRQNSREKRDNSRERRNHSAEGRGDGSRERRRSRERAHSRERSDNSRERQSGRSKERSRDQTTRKDSIKGRHRSRSGDRHQHPKTGHIAPHNCNGISAFDGSPERDFQLTNRTLTIEVGDTNTNGEITTLEKTEGRKREREHASQGASLERRKKRRSTGEMGVKSSSTNASTYPLTLTNGFSAAPTNGYAAQPMDCESPHTPSPQALKDSTPVKQRSKRSSKNSNRTHENRHSMPTVVHRNR